MLFAVASAGATPDRVWAAGLCRGDVNATNCQACLTQAFRDLPNTCSYAKDATIYYDPCVLRYSSARVLSGADTDDSDSPYSTASALNVTSDLAQFNRVVANLINATAEYAAANSMRRFATGAAGFDQDVPMVYAVAQCTPDQTTAACRSCLAGMIDRNLGGMENAIYGRIFWMNCNFRYEIVPFFNGPPDVKLASPFPPAPTTVQAPAGQPMIGTGDGGRNHRKVLIIALVASLSVFFAVLLGCVLVFTRLRQGHAIKSSKTQEALKLWRIEESDSDFTLYDFNEMAAATGNFSVSNRLGRGGFGPVYKASGPAGQLHDGVEIAVKRLSAQSLQGLVEFKNEIQLIAKLQHTNLVRLVGCCVHEEEKMLVYEYMPNGSLDFFLFDPVRGRLLDWKKRIHIIEGIVQGLLYLHKHSRVRIIHRDLKASNILLDKDLNPKISDFGMARIFCANITKANTNRVVGT
ncbi:hypothetical protein QOZ80_7BG0602400 [Eleusine coracana subsp. coracana]|nr:hypothetical protein QOZ80_7BG0602400 [Eleusine coracana subsp. coracana]